MPPDADGAFGVLFVCTGNICRSPTAEALARRELARYPGAPIQLSSAGSHALEGNPAASRSMLAASSRGASQWHWLATSPADLVALAAEHRQPEQPGDDIDDPSASRRRPTRPAPSASTAWSPP
jgi:Low molecular weight phosphotyrosine protein phosphatase